MGQNECCSTDGNKCCRAFRCVLALVMAGLLTCIATSLWQIEGHLAAMAAK